jgi:hypothetical protein
VVAVPDPDHALPVADPGEEVLDLSVPRARRVLFKVDPEDDAELFEAAPRLPTGLAVEIANLGEQLTAGQPGANGQEGSAAKIERFLVFFDRVLFPGSRERFRARLSDVRQPIDPAQLTSIIQGLLGRWGLRPTQPSPASSGPPPGPDAGTPSTATSPFGASIPASSPSTGS